VKEEAERLRLLAEERERNLKLIQDETREVALRKPILEDTVAVFESNFIDILKIKFVMLNFI